MMELLKKEKLVKINYEYLESKQCQLEWIEKKTIMKKNIIF